ncbi:MAG: hypothetical protein AAB390_00570 [Patescibacteria group bacterium]
MENKFKKGLILGGLLAAGAAIGLAMTKGGKELSEELQKDLKTLARHLKKGLHNLDDVTKESFDTLVATIVEEYSKKKELAIDTKKALVDALEEKWQEMEIEYLAEKDYKGEK